jgi:hypothetical protein
MSFSTHTETILRQAGWHPDRAIDVTLYLQTLQANGYTVFPSVQSFLRQFGGLQIYFTIEYRGKPLQNHIHFDAAAAAQAVWNEGYISLYAQRIGEPVCVIGEADNESTTLMMDAHGRVYGGFDVYLYRLGESGLQAIEQIVELKPVIPIPL